MANAIQFLESMGGNSALARASTHDYAAAIAALDEDEAQQQALLSRDQSALNDLLGGRLKMVFAILTPDDEPLPLEDVPAREEPEPEEAPSAY